MLYTRRPCKCRLTYYQNTFQKEVYHGARLSVRYHRIRSHRSMHHRSPHTSRPVLALDQRSKALIFPHFLRLLSSHKFHKLR